MAQTAGRSGAGLDTHLRVVFWSGAALLLLAPLAATLLDALPWDEADFIFVGVLLGMAGIAFEATMRMSSSWTYRFAAGFAVAAACLILVATGAVGMVGDEGDPYNLVFLGVIALGVGGAILARLRPEGMARAMGLAAAAQIAAGGYGMLTDFRGGLFSALFGGLGLASAVLFARAAREQVRSG